MNKGYGMLGKGLLLLLICVAGLSAAQPARAQTAPHGLCVPIVGFASLGGSNNPTEVRKIQEFLAQYENLEVPISGIYDEATAAAVKVFQERHADKVLAPWGATKATGYVYITTRNAMNVILCGTQAPLSAQEKNIIAAYRAHRTGAKTAAVGEKKTAPRTSAAPVSNVKAPIAANAAPSAGITPKVAKEPEPKTEIAVLPSAERSAEISLVSAGGISEVQPVVTPRKKSESLFSWTGVVKDHLLWFWDSF